MTRRFSRHLQLGFLALLGLLQLQAVPGHYLGAEHDDAQYFLAAHALARGEYRLGIGPGEPPLTDLTPGWPALLSPAALVGGSPGVMELWAWAWLVLCDVLLWLWLRRRWGDAAALAGAALFAANPLILSRAGLLMSEIPALAVVMGLLLLMDASPAPGAAAGLCLSLAWLIRPASIAAYPMAAAHYAMGWRAARGAQARRRWLRQAAIAGACAAAGPLLWRAWARSVGGELSEVGELATSFGGRGAAAVLSVAASNASAAAELLGRISLPLLPRAELAGAARLLGLGLAAACAWGLLRDKRRCGPALWLLAATTLMHLGWPWWYERYLLAFFPVLILGWGAALPEKTRAWVLAAAAALAFAVQGRAVTAQVPRSAPELAPAYAWIRDNTPPQALFAAPLYCRDALYAARPFLPMPRPGEEGVRALARRGVRYVLWQDPADLGSAFGSDSPWERELSAWRARLERPPFRQVYRQADGLGRVFELVNVTKVTGFLGAVK
ncbi:MAG TPA: hypothetical protein VNI01_00325 [Elusimicrobiota bacterium]|jgi:hypothetical protein|nr:hypothetical protein [Elusimicrobiota bacterium]